MKSDINLLYKRKTKTYSSKKIVVTVLLLVLSAGALYAGIAIPSAALRAAKLEAAEIESKLLSFGLTQQELADKSQQGARLSLQLTELNKLNETRNGASDYLKAIEDSLPKKANVFHLLMKGQTIEIRGFADDDDMVATFCLRLKEQNIFRDVFVNGTVSVMEEEYFEITVTLPDKLSSEDIIAAIEKKDDVTAASAAAPEVSK